MSDSNADWRIDILPPSREPLGYPLDIPGYHFTLHPPERVIFDAEQRHGMLLPTDYLADGPRQWCESEISGTIRAYAPIVAEDRLSYVARFWFSEFDDAVMFRLTWC